MDSISITAARACKSRPSDPTRTSQQFLSGFINTVVEILAETQRQIETGKTLEGPGVDILLFASSSDLPSKARDPKDHMNIRILQPMISGIPLILGLGT